MIGFHNILAFDNCQNSKGIKNMFKYLFSLMVGLMVAFVVLMFSVLIYNTTIPCRVTQYNDAGQVINTYRNATRIYGELNSGNSITFKYNDNLVTLSGTFKVEKE
jgi:hypothetical protein